MGEERAKKVLAPERSLRWWLFTATGDKDWLDRECPPGFLEEAEAARVDQLDGFAMVCSYVRNWSGYSDRYVSPATILGFPAAEEEEQTPEQMMAAMGRAATVIEVDNE